MTSEPYRIGIAGLGTVGAGVVKILQKHGDLIKERASRPIEIVCVSARSKDKDRGFNVEAYTWHADPLAMTDDPSLDAVVELIGGSEGLAKELAERTLAAGKDYITANKALIAHHGYELAKLADEYGGSLMYEAAVAGGIPIIKSIREGFAGNQIEAVYGILNGTCNYILTEMEASGRDFEDVLKEAQAMGYAEADPSFDVDGIDTAHKLAILSALSFGVRPGFESVSTEGIRRVTAEDIRCAEELGFKIKLLGSVRRLSETGGLTQVVSPCLVPKESTIAAVDGALNAVYVQADSIDTSLSVGRGAGEFPTASAVLSDIVDCARGLKMPAFGVPAPVLEEAEWSPCGALEARFYLRLIVTDQPGVLADVSSVMRDHKISMESLIQRGRDPDKPVSIIMTSHHAKQSEFVAALKRIEGIKTVMAPPVFMRIEEL